MLDFAIGDIRENNKGEKYEILEINGAKVSTGGVVIRFVECGSLRVTDYKSIRNGSINSKKKTVIKPGDKYNRLTVIERFSPKGEANSKWLCLCECGNYSTPTAIGLTSGKSKSCGCYRDEMAGTHTRTHGMTNTKEHVIWQAMKQRCYDKNKDNYKWYGGRGIEVDPVWLEDFMAFYNDMGPCPEGLTLERKDPNKNYCKENCCWATRNMQGYNTNVRSNNTSGRTGVYLKPDGKYGAHIGTESRLIHLGTFETFEDAVKAREEAELKYYGFIKE